MTQAGSLLPSSLILLRSAYQVHIPITIVNGGRFFRFKMYLIASQGIINSSQVLKVHAHAQFIPNPDHVAAFEKKGGHRPHLSHCTPHTGYQSSSLDILGLI